MRVATWNVNSILARIPQVTRWLEVAKPDVVCMQETKCTDDKFPTAELEALGYHCVTFGQRTYNGVAILSRDQCEQPQRGYEGDPADSHARLIAVTVNGVRIVNVYIPNGRSVGSEQYVFKLNWMQRLREYFDTCYTADTSIILCGDFNVAPEDIDVHDPMLWQGRIMCSKPERRALNLIKNWGFEDTFRMHFEDGGHFTWWDYRMGAFRRNHGLRIDHIWASTVIAGRCKAAWIDREVRGWERPSDHAPVISEFHVRQS